MRGLVEACRRDRFVTTIGGRRRYLLDIDSADSGRRAAAERQAINSAVQVNTPLMVLDFGEFADRSFSKTYNGFLQATKDPLGLLKSLPGIAGMPLHQ